MRFGDYKAIPPNREEAEAIYKMSINGGAKGAALGLTTAGAIVGAGLLAPYLSVLSLSTLATACTIESTPESSNEIIKVPQNESPQAPPLPDEIEPLPESSTDSNIPLEDNYRNYEARSQYIYDMSITPDNNILLGGVQHHVECTRKEDLEIYCKAEVVADEEWQFIDCNDIDSYEHSIEIYCEPVPEDEEPGKCYFEFNLPSCHYIDHTMMLTQVDGQSGRINWTLDPNNEDNYFNGGANSIATNDWGETLAVRNFDPFDGAGSTKAIKFDEDGNIVCETTLATSSGKPPLYFDSSFDSSGSIYLVGSVATSEDAMLIPLGRDRTITKLSADCRVIWSKLIPDNFSIEGDETNFNDDANSIAFSSDGNLIIGGYTTISAIRDEQDPIIDDMFGPSHTTETGTWLAKVNPEDGQIIWENNYSISTDLKNDKILNVASLKDNQSLILTENNKVSKIKEDGNIEWTINLAEYGNTLKMVESKNNGIYVLGKNSETNKTWVLNLDANGNPIWTKEMDSEGMSPTNIAVDADGNLYVTFYGESESIHVRKYIVE